MRDQLHEAHAHMTRKAKSFADGHRLLRSWKEQLVITVKSQHIQPPRTSLYHNAQFAVSHANILQRELLEPELNERSLEELERNHKKPHAHLVEVPEAHGLEEKGKEVTPTSIGTGTALRTTHVRKAKAGCGRRGNLTSRDEHRMVLTRKKEMRGSTPVLATPMRILKKEGTTTFAEDED
eukprot:4238303-Amphidinium_carterae.2